ncbi:MAG: sialidase family protein [Acidobacteriota bacterium]|nr:sialidase family protein [Acidobacteriota bacterium]
MLSRVRVNPPGVQAFVETFFSHNQLKLDPGGDLIIGFAAVRDTNKAKDTDVFVSRFVRSEDRWSSPVPIAGGPDLERSPTIRIDGKSGAIHAAWVGNRRQKAGGPRSELRVGYRRSEDEGNTWTPPRFFAVGTALARRPQLMGGGKGRLYLVISNGHPGGQERIHLFQSPDGGKDWRPVDVNFPEEEKRRDTGSPHLEAGPDNRAYLVWADPTKGRRAVVFSRTTGESTWSPPVRVNDDASMNCMEPRLAVHGDSVYVAWHVVDGDRTTLYFDQSPDGGATWNEDQVIFDRKALSVQASLQTFDSGILAGWVESETQMGRTNRNLSYRLYSPAIGWTAPKGERDSLAGAHGPGRFYYGFDLLPWEKGCLVAYSKGALGLSPEIYLAWSRDLNAGFSELMKISAPKKGFEHLYPRLIRSGDNEVAVVYNRRKIRRSPFEPRVILGDVLVARIGIP